MDLFSLIFFLLISLYIVVLCDFMPFWLAFIVVFLSIGAVFPMCKLLKKCWDKFRSVSDIKKIRKQILFTPLNDNLIQDIQQNLTLEILFYFTRPLLTTEEFNQKAFSLRFREKICGYDEYKRCWENIYWKYSLEMKVHKLLNDLMSDKYISSNGDFDEKFYYKIENKLNKKLLRSERAYYIRAIINKERDLYDLFPNSLYRQLWVRKGTKEFEELYLADYCERIRKTSQNLIDFIGIYGETWQDSYAIWLKKFDSVR